MNEAVQVWASLNDSEKADVALETAHLPRVYELLQALDRDLAKFGQWEVRGHGPVPVLKTTPPEGLRDSLGTACAGCGHLRNFHEYSDLICVVKLDQHGFSRCGCTYRSPNAGQAASDTGSNAGEPS